MRTFWIWISLSLLLQNILSKHQCINDEVAESYQGEVQDLPVDNPSLRSLKERIPRKMIISYDMTYFYGLDQNISSNNKLKQYCERALKIAVKFFSDLITTIPKPSGNMKWDVSKESCGKVPIPIEDKQKGKKSDLHLYVSYSDESERSYYVTASWCRFLKAYGPSHGFVNFNLSRLREQRLKEPLIFYNLVEYVIHELTHVLGFQYRDIKHWVNELKQPYINPTSEQLIRGLNTTILQTPHVKEYARQYYGCSNLAGMPLENQDKKGTTGSHWETTILSNEILNASISSSYNILSGFTLALLRDTGFYYAVNADLEEQSFYGRDTGCTFVTGECNNEQREYCDSTKDECNYYGFSVSSCKNNKPYLDIGCNQYKSLSRGSCIEAKSNLQNDEQTIQKYGISFGQNSRCFMSSLSRQLEEGEGEEQEEAQALCYNFHCNDSHDQVIISVGDQNVVCSYNNQMVYLPNWSGSLRCPKNIEQYCLQKKLCPSSCSFRGYCNKGQCRCLEGYMGEDCSQKAD